MKYCKRENRKDSDAHTFCMRRLVNVFRISGAFVYDSVQFVADQTQMLFACCCLQFLRIRNANVWRELCKSMAFKMYTDNLQHIEEWGSFRNSQNMDGKNACLFQSARPHRWTQLCSTLIWLRAQLVCDSNQGMLYLGAMYWFSIECCWVADEYIILSRWATICE